MIHIAPAATDISTAMAVFRNVLAEGVLAWSSQTADGFAANALGPQTYDFWTPTSVPATLSVTLGSAVECDACAIVAHTLGGAGATLEVQWWDGSAWVTAQAVTPDDDRDIVLIFGAVASARWRIRLTGAVASIGVAMIGPRFFFPRGVQAGYIPLNQALSVELMTNVTRGGQYLGTRIQKTGAGTSIPLAQHERWWFENDAGDFIAHYNAGLPFIWAACPELLPDDMGYCWRAGDATSVTYGAGSVWGDMSMQVQAYVGS